MLFVSIAAVSSTSLETRADEPLLEWKEKYWGDLTGKKLPRVYFDDKIAVYWSEDIKSDTIPDAKRDFLIKAWTQVTKTYGKFGDENRLYVVCHEVKGKTGRYGGSYLHERYEHKNVISMIFPDGRWSSPGLSSTEAGDFLLAMSNIVESSYAGIDGRPTERIWGKNYEKIFAYDILMGMGDRKGAQYVDQRYSKELPEWYGKWFSKIWKQNFLKEYFQLLVQYWPKENGKYTRELTYGDYLHFSSGAVGKDLTSQYKEAFGWDDETAEELKDSRAEFSKVRY